MPIGREVRRYEDIRNYLYRPGPLAAIKRIVHAEQEAVLIPRFIYDLWNRTEPRRGRGQIPALAAKLCETVAWNSLVEPYSLHQAFGHVRAGIQTRLSSVCIASDIRTADGVILDEPRRIVIVSVLTGDGLSNEWRAIAAYERNGTIEARMLPRRITYGEIEQHIQNNSPHNVLPPRIELPYLDGEGRISMVQLVAESQEPLQPDQLASPRILEMAARYARNLPHGVMGAPHPAARLNRGGPLPPAPPPAAAPPPPPAPPPVRDRAQLGRRPVIPAQRRNDHNSDSDDEPRPPRAARRGGGRGVPPPPHSSSDSDDEPRMPRTAGHGGRRGVPPPSPRSSK